MRKNGSFYKTTIGRFGPFCLILHMLQLYRCAFFYITFPLFMLTVFLSPSQHRKNEVPFTIIDYIPTVKYLRYKENVAINVGDEEPLLTILTVSYY